MQSHTTCLTDFVLLLLLVAAFLVQNILLVPSMFRFITRPEPCWLGRDQETRAVLLNTVDTDPRLTALLEEVLTTGTRDGHGLPPSEDVKLSISR